MASRSDGFALLRVSAPALLGLLMGCSDGGIDFVRPDFDDLLDESLALRDDFESLDPARPEDLPTTGVASYDGVLVMETDDDQTLAGEMSVNVDFGDARDPISGEVSDIVDEDAGRYDGTLDVSDSRLDREGTLLEGPVFSADLGGTLVDPDGVEQDVDADLNGSFAGSENDAISHVGGFTEGESCAGEDCVGFDGAFVLERTGGLDISGDVDGGPLGAVQGDGSDGL